MNSEIHMVFLEIWLRFSAALPDLSKIKGPAKCPAGMKPTDLEGPIRFINERDITVSGSMDGTSSPSTVKLHPQARGIIYNVLGYFSKEKQNAI